MTDQKRNVSFVESVLRRSAMYTLNGRYEEVIAFLEGYISGLAQSNACVPRVMRWN